MRYQIQRAVLRDPELDDLPVEELGILLRLARLRDRHGRKAVEPDRVFRELRLDRDQWFERIAYLVCNFIAVAEERCEAYIAFEERRSLAVRDPLRVPATDQRVTVLERDRYECRYCGADAAEIDHVVPWSRGGRTTDDNLVASCRRCNRSKRDKKWEPRPLDAAEAT